MVLTSVISVRGKNRDELLSSSEFVYVGRDFGKGWWKGSKWGNPYGYLGKQHSYLQYHASMKAAALSIIIGYQPQSDESDRFRDLIYSIDELKGKILGCWCGNWTAGSPLIECHACELAILSNCNSLEDYLDFFEW